jgi:putative transposase
MGRLHLTPGTRYLHEGHVFVIRQLLLDRRVLVENQSVGGQAVLTRDEIGTLWGRGALTFEVQGRQARPDAERTLPTAYTIADVHLLPEDQRAEAWRRYTLIRPLLALPPRERTRRAIEQYLAGARLRHDPETSTPSRTSIERYLRAFEDSGGDLRSLVPAILRRDAGDPRVAAEVEGIIQEVLAACRAAPAYRTVRDVFLMIVQRIGEANRARPATDQIALPGQTTIYRRVQAAGAPAILRRRPSRTEAHAHAAAQPGPRLSRPLERVEIDHTSLDLILVDEDDRLPIGRPTVTLALDVFTGFPAGVHVAFEPAGYSAAMRCLAHSILPKDDTRTRYGTTHPWPVYGLPETLVVDNAAHLIGADLADACAQLGIILAPAPVKRPWFKGAIERQFRTHNTGLIHTLPGSTFSHLLQRGDYDPVRDACISLTRFWEILHIYLLDFYAQDGHVGMRLMPAKQWADSLVRGWAPALHPDAGEVRMLLGRIARRTIQRTGIDHLCLRYQSADLDELRRALPAGAAVTVKYDPEDLGTLYVCDPTQERHWLPVPAIEQDYARGLSLWKHRVIQAYARQTMREVVDIAALATAKARIQAIVEEEFRRTRKTQRRTRAARFLGRGTTGAPTVSPHPSPPAPVPPDAAPALPVWTREVPAPDPEAGWGADYGLPRDVRRDPWR